MARTAQLLALTAAAALAGCFAGLDDGPLTRGPGADAGASAPNGSMCDDFSGDTAGAGADGWSFEGGRWMVTSGGAANALVQVSPNLTSRAYAIYGDDAWTDYTVSVTLTPTQTASSDCLDARWRDDGNHYSLCLRDGDSWNVSKYRNGQRMQLAGGDAIYSPGSAHVLALGFAGDAITPIVDGDVKDTFSDGQLDHGSVGVSTSSLLTVSKLCVIRP